MADVRTRHSPDPPVRDGSNASNDGRKRRTVSGCLTCRIRRVKCDEGKPSCNNCVRSKRSCDGYPEARVVRKKKPDTSKESDALQAIWTTRITPQRDAAGERFLQPLPYTSNEEKMSFDMFLLGISNSHRLRDVAVPDFWRLVLQLTSSEPAIRSLALALGAFTRRTQSSAVIPQFDTRSLDTFMLKHYGEALQETREMISRADKESDISIVLVACALFVWFETLSGHFETADQHLSRGTHILTDNLGAGDEEHESYLPGTFEGNMQLISDSLARVDLQMNTFRPYQSAYPYPESILRPEDVPSPEESFMSLQEAIADMARIWKLILDFSHISYCHLINPFAAPAVREDINKRKLRCQLALAEWKEAFREIETRVFGQPGLTRGTQHQQDTCKLLRVYHELCSLLLNLCTDLETADFDRETPRFEHILDILEGMGNDQFEEPHGWPYSSNLKVGVLSNLFVIACKCRDIRIRRRAISLLEARDVCSGHNRGYGTAEVAKKVLEYEQSLARSYVRTQITTADQVPSEAQVVAVDVRHYRWQRVDLRFLPMQQFKNAGCHRRRQA